MISKDINKIYLLRSYELVLNIIFAKKQLKYNFILRYYITKEK